jgi:hypothetical protein
MINNIPEIFEEFKNLQKYKLILQTLIEKTVGLEEVPKLKIDQLKNLCSSIDESLIEDFWNEMHIKIGITRNISDTKEYLNDNSFSDIYEFLFEKYEMKEDDLLDMEDENIKIILNSSDGNYFNEEKFQSL